MKLRVGTFNVENLLARYRFEPGGRVETAAARVPLHPRPLTVDLEIPQDDPKDA